ncbi:membrane protein insertase YidC [Natronoglycomyces albus]|uniref:Membrane protein insertase YidC n=1 Tax=Natronoglycomyces albus TaxID=2811108 RepID=A0A895XHR1_9ACTN|nr:membrane protein insertase YidC [Natronoglycomyces albus]QSB05371.1 membrane protein insertase YidC [Natronoglycomyces albus]
MNWIYTALSWALLKWHDLWATVVPETEVWATTWVWVLAIVFLVITLRVIMFPLFMKQIRAQRAMQTLAPQIKELQQRYKGDKETLQRETMKLYREEKANPLMGCLPILIQMPVFLGLFWVLRRVDPDKTSTYPQTLYTWTPEHWNSYLDSKLFGAPFWASFLESSEKLDSVEASGTTVKIVAAVLVAIMIVTTYLTARQMILKSGWAQEPQQRMLQKLMLYGIPVLLLFSGGIFPIGVVIYWVINNLFSLAQQQYVLRKYPPPKMNGNNKPVKPPKPGSKEDLRLKEEQRLEEERRKSLAPKPGQKPKRPPNKKPSGDASAGSKPSNGKNLSRAERIARAKKVSGAKQSGKKNKN